MTDIAAGFPDFLERDADEAARLLLGCLLVRTLPEGRIAARIVETEAYDQFDPASHSFHGMSHRTRAMFGPAGRAYVYFTYGMYYCFNVTLGKPGTGSAALIRAVEPIEGMDIVERRRGRTGVGCVNGPAKLCQALGIGPDLYGHDLRKDPLRLVVGTLQDSERVGISTRIGITRAVERERRFTIAGNAYLSRRVSVTHRYF